MFLRATILIAALLPTFAGASSCVGEQQASSELESEVSLTRVAIRDDQTTWLVIAPGNLRNHYLKNIFLTAGSDEIVASLDVSLMNEKSHALFSIPTGSESTHTIRLWYTDEHDGSLCVVMHDVEVGT